MGEARANTECGPVTAVARYLLALAAAVLIAVLCCGGAPARAAHAEDLAITADDLEKTETPTVTKEIGEVTNATEGGEPEGWYASADATVGEAVPYRATGTLPSNWDKFETYYYEFCDTQDAAIVVDVDSVAVTLARTATGESEDITAAFTVAYDAEAHVLTATCADLKSAAEGIAAEDTIVLSYTAALDPALATTGTADPAINYVYLRYSAHPATDGIGQTPEASTKLYTWALQVQKLAEDTGAALAGAGFTIQAEDGRYVAADGSLTSEAVELYVDDAGQLLVSGVDAGTYTVRETTAPAGYTAVGAITVTISSAATSGTPQLTVRVTPTNAGEATAASASNATGVLAVTVVDAPEPDEPSITTVITKITGGTPQTGDTAWWLVVLALLVLAAAALGAGLWLRRRQAAGTRAGSADGPDGPDGAEARR